MTWRVTANWRLRSLRREVARHVDAYACLAQRCSYPRGSAFQLLRLHVGDTIFEFPLGTTRDEAQAAIDEAKRVYHG